ncbi:MAG: hypothetical protein RL701_3769 [Pseudomonadota bacterium]
MSIDKTVTLIDHDAPLTAARTPVQATRTTRPKNAPRALFEASIVKRAIRESFAKLDPRIVAKNPVMLVVEVGSAITTYFFIRGLLLGSSDTLFVGQVALWLWFTVLFANFAEAMAEGRGKAQADSLRKAKTDTMARKLVGKREERVSAPQLAKGDLFVCEPGDVIAADGEIVEGIASVDESAITGESAPVIRESGGDRSAVTGGTKVLSDRIIVRVTQDPGHSFLDRMIALVEGAKRQKTPNEIALSILLSGLTIIFLLATVTLLPFAHYAAGDTGQVPSIPVLVALLVCLIPTTIGGLLSAIGIAGMDRVMQHNVLAMSGKAVEAAGDVNTLLLDKTGTITLGNRQATAFYPANGVTLATLTRAAQLASLSDETPEGRSIITYAIEKCAAPVREARDFPEAVFVEFTAQTRMSGVDIADDTAHARVQIRKGAADSVKRFVEEQAGVYPSDVRSTVERVSREGATPLVVAEGSRVLGVIQLKDIVKSGMKQRFVQLREMGIKTVMITGDNPLTAAAIAADAGVDDFLAEATPEMKLAFIRKEQAGGRLVAMTGDGTNDAPALAQADVGVAMNTGTAAAKEAGNMVDLDSDPTKLIEVVEIGKQMLMTRGSLTTFSIANDVAKYFAIIPAMFLVTYPALGNLNFMHLSNPQSAVLAAVIFNALIIIALIPLSLRGVSYRPANAVTVLRRNLLIYGVGGVIAPFPAIWLIDRLLVALRLA